MIRSKNTLTHAFLSHFRTNHTYHNSLPERSRLLSRFHLIIIIFFLKVEDQGLFWRQVKQENEAIHAMFTAQKMRPNVERRANMRLR